ncbi:MAG: ribokinase [Oscillatoriales cyanobacterium C42_A2020_001]|nr:ribokinase [Leptolyngbyaceae cyanobacterium C42_A2020_001]
MSVIVFGSLNMDLVSRTPRLPLPGETIIGSNFFTTPGGKGANQAVAIARLGIPTVMIGRVGGDAFGQELLAALQAATVDISGVMVDGSTHSGVAIITVTDMGENQIIGVLGANAQMNDTDVERLQQQIPQTKVLMLQLEIPIPVVKAAAKAAHAAGVVVMLDPAPAPVESIADLYPFVDFLLPNEVEAGQLVGFSVNSPETAAKAASILQQQGVKTVVIKLGAQGVFCASPDVTLFVPAFSVNAIDTVAAGDAFAGGFAAALVEGLPLQQSLTWGCAAGALATTKVGAQAAMSDRAPFLSFLAQHKVNFSNSQL